MNGRPMSGLWGIGARTPDSHRFRGGARAPGTGILLAVLALVIPMALHAQPANPGVSVGVTHESYRFSAEEATGLRSVSLTTLPFAAQLDLHRAIRLRVRGVHAAGEIERSDRSTARMTGLSDTELQLETSLRGDRLRVSAIVALPTGHSAYTRDEADVAGAIAADVLPFRLTNWGSGGGLGLHSAATRRAGGFELGLSASYMAGREFQLYDTDPQGFRRGDQFTLTAAADRNVGLSGKASLQLGLTHHRDDELAGLPLYRSGSRFQALAAYSFAAPRLSSALVYGGALHRSEGTFLGVTGTLARQNLFVTGAVLRVPFTWGVFVPSVELRALRSADGMGQGYTTTLGGSAERTIGPTTLIPTLRARFGRVLVSEASRSGFTGVEIGLTSRFGGTTR